MCTYPAWVCQNPHSTAIALAFACSLQVQVGGRSLARWVLRLHNTRALENKNKKSGVCVACVRTLFLFASASLP